MNKVTRWLATSSLVGAFAFMLSVEEAAAQKPDYSGKWQINLEKSDDMAFKIRDAVGATGEITRSDVRLIADRLTELASAVEWLEIEQSEKDFKIFDRDDNVRIYYLDGKKHPRQTPWGAMLQAQTGWNKDLLIVNTEGKDLGSISEIYGREDDQLLFLLQVENKKFEKTLIVRSYYDRADSR
jgi:hypothetical protein